MPEEFPPRTDTVKAPPETPDSAGTGAPPRQTHAARHEPFVLLEDRLDANGGALLFTGPVSIIRCDEASEVDSVFEALEAGLAAGFHAAGYMSYELGHILEPQLTRHLPATRALPLLWIGLFPPPRRVPNAVADRYFVRLGPPPPLTDLAAANDRALHAEKIARLLEYIRSGDIYQVNLTFPFSFTSEGSPLSIYAALRAVQPVAYGGVINLGDASVLSVSPELFIQCRGDTIEARPMKGTARRDADNSVDLRLQSELRLDPKQRAENLMIVDLLRNDMARISVPGTMTVPEIFTVETYPTFHALTSTIRAKLDTSTTVRERLTALFPCGSVVGAPKIRAAEIIAELEDQPREVYTGAIGAITPERDLVLNVAIRTAVIGLDGRGRYDVGGAIVADSAASAEYDEALLKAKILTDLSTGYKLVEQIRWCPREGFYRLDDHLERLHRSARHLGFREDRHALLRHLSDASMGWPAGRRLRVHVFLDRDGSLDIRTSPIREFGQSLRFGISAQRVDAADPFLRHRTTRRPIQEASRMSEQHLGFDDVIVCNRAGNVADGAQRTIFASIGGQLLTPPISSGALPTVGRAEMIATKRAFPAELNLQMLEQAEALWAGDLIFGLFPAKLCQS